MLDHVGACYLRLYTLEEYERFVSDHDTIQTVADSHTPDIAAV